MLKVYKMPNGRRYLFDDKDVPKGATLVEKKKPAPGPPKPEKKAEKKEEPAKANKAKKTANKSKKAATK